MLRFNKKHYFILTSSAKLVKFKIQTLQYTVHVLFWYIQRIVNRLYCSYLSTCILISLLVHFMPVRTHHWLTQIKPPPLSETVKSAKNNITVIIGVSLVNALIQINGFIYSV